MKIKGREIMWMSPKGNVAITYSQFALGGQYTIYHKKYYRTEDGDYQPNWDYTITFETYFEALRYANKMNDLRCEE